MALAGKPIFHQALLRFPGLAAALGWSWIDLCNPGERIQRTPGQSGVRCDWLECRAIERASGERALGRRLLSRVLADWEVAFASAPQASARPAAISFIIGHRGVDKIPHLLATLATVAAQSGPPAECIVVEQSAERELTGRLPPWVRWIHTPPPDPAMLFSRSWAFNVGARAATGRYLIFLDNDICLPRAFSAEVVSRLREGFQAARLHRLVFYLTARHTGEVLATRRLVASGAPARVMQNSEGHTVAVEREAYLSLGGHDEGFLGWGGEDNEFLDRCRACRLHDHSYLPLFHLDHPPQPMKGPAPPTFGYFRSRISVPREIRIRELQRVGWGDPAGPAPPQGAGVSRPAERPRSPGCG